MIANSEILYDNRFADAAPVASSTAAGYDPRFIADWRAYTYWAATSAADQTITVDCGSAASADTLALTNHNLGGAKLLVQGSSDGSTFTTLTGIDIDADDSMVIYCKVPSSSYRYWRIKLENLSVAPYIGILALGVALVMNRPLQDGEFSPADEAANNITSVSRYGDVLGVVQLVRVLTTTLNWTVTDAWYRSTFIEAWSVHLGQCIPFFFAPDRESNDVVDSYFTEVQLLLHFDNITPNMIEAYLYRVASGSTLTAKFNTSYFRDIAMSVEGVL